MYQSRVLQRRCSEKLLHKFHYHCKIQLYLSQIQIFDMRNPLKTLNFSIVGKLKAYSILFLKIHTKDAHLIQTPHQGLMTGQSFQVC